LEALEQDVASNSSLLEVRILAVNMASDANVPLPAGYGLPMAQDLPEIGMWGTWGIQWRDLILVNALRAADELFQSNPKAKLASLKGAVKRLSNASVASGKESQRVIDTCSQPDYREKLDAELTEMRESELWQAGKAVRSLRPGKLVKKEELV
jgi:hypothetical protein